MSDRPSQIESLLRLAGERDRPSTEGFERAREAARRSWQGSLNRGAAPRRARSWRALGWAMATGIAVVTAVFWPRHRMMPPVAVAHVSAVTGEARVLARERAGSGPSVDRRVAGAPVSLASVLSGGDVLTTLDGRVALAVGDALSLRVDRHTRLRFDDAGQVTLLEGAVYVDSGGLNAHTALRIDTPAGAVRHVGTQFQVAVHAAVTRVQVREGRVVVTPAVGAPLDLGAGDLARMERGSLDLRHDQAASGEAWEWAAATAPPFDIENRPLSEFLAWLAREQGWQLRYADPTLQSRAQEIRLHGSLADLDAAAMLERAALITGVPLAIEGGSLQVGATR